MDKTNRILIAVRVRPMSLNEISMGSKLIVSTRSGGEICLLNPGYFEMKTQTDQTRRMYQHPFTYDFSFNSILDETNKDYCSQKDIFDVIGKPIIANSLMGHNCSLFAYGIYSIYNSIYFMNSYYF